MNNRFIFRMLFWGMLFIAAAIMGIYGMILNQNKTINEDVYNPQQDPVPYYEDIILPEEDFLQ